jgi:hypothetical protein
MELRDALSDISEIRQRLAGAEVFRGYRAASTAATGAVAIGVSLAQSIWGPDDPLGFVLLWVGAAVLNMGIVAAEMIARCRRSQSSLQRASTLGAAQAFLPSLVAGGLLTFVIVRFAEPQVWMLPGLWAVVFSLGLFASRRILPGAINFVAGYYLIAGLLAIALASPAHALWPWTMGILFGFGQLTCAAILYWTLERNPDGRRIEINCE